MITHGWDHDNSCPLVNEPITLVGNPATFSTGSGWAFKLPDNTLARYTESQSTVLFKDEVEASQAFGKQPGKAVRVKVVEVGPDLSGDGVKVGE